MSCTFRRHVENKTSAADRLFEDANTTLLPGLGAWFRPLIGKAQYTKGGVDAAKAAALKQAAYLEGVLADKTFLVGHRITLADIFVASALARGAEFVRPPAPAFRFL